jgi:small-conductance mechanosensitive channel
VAPAQPPATQPAAAAPAANEALRAESAGLLGQITELFALSRRMHELNTLIEQTNALRQQNDKLRQPIRTALHEALAGADALGSTTAPATSAPIDDDPARLDAQRQQVQALTARFRLIAAASVPLGEQSTFLEVARDNLIEWRADLARQYASLLRHVLLRLLSLALATAVVFGLSALWRRAALRYVQDPRRRRQILLVRRVVVAVVLLMVAIVTFVSEIGSLATFAGIITAGIAVALQTFILSGVAYFFFVGRYGVRVGDRVTVGGTTGEVLETGLFRLYLMELGGSDKLRPTGRIVVFSNSVLLQPGGFYKQLPGAEYVYHEVALTLSPDTDHHIAEERLMAAVSEVYEGYRPEVERQHAAAKAEAHLPLPEPRPEGRLHFVESGLEYVIRYPVVLRRAAEIDDRVTRTLLAAIESEPKLKLVAAGTPRIQPA